MKNFLKAWISSIFSNERSSREIFNVADPKAIGEPVRTIVLSTTPGEDLNTIISVYWDKSNQKVFEKEFEDQQEVQTLYSALKHDLEEVSTLTGEKKIDEAKMLMTSLLEKYSLHSDPLVQMDVQPVTTTNANLKTANIDEAFDVINMKPIEYILGLAEQVSQLEGVPLTPARLKQSLEEDSKMLVDINEAKELLNIVKRTVFASDKLSKEAKVVMQNIFFETPDEALEYQEKMKALQPEPTVSETEPSVEEIAPELGPPSVSYEQVEKGKAEEQKDLTKRIEDEVEEQVQSALDKKVATMFTEKDEMLVIAMRGVGRTWEEIRDYLIKNLKYDKDGVAAFLDQLKGKETTELVDEPKMEPPKPPEDLVTPETHEKLLEELPKEEMPEEVVEAPKEIEVEEIAKQDDEIKKVAIEPLEIAPEIPIEEPIEEEPIEDLFPPQESINTGDHVYVMSDFETQDLGFEGTLINTFTEAGDKYAVVESMDKELKEVPMYLVTKADLKKLKLQKKADSIQRGNAYVIRFLDQIDIEIDPKVIEILKANVTDDVKFDTIKARVIELMNNLPDDEQIQIKQVDWSDPEISFGDIQKIIEDDNEDKTIQKELEEKKSSELKSDLLVTIKAEMTSLENSVGEIEKEATPPEPEVKPVTQEIPIVPKKLKIAPPETKREEAIPATPEIEAQYREVQIAEQNLETIKNLISQTQTKFNEEKRRIEEQGGKIANERTLKESIERLAGLVAATEPRLVSLGDTLVKFVEKEKEIPVKYTDKEKLDKIFEKFPETKTYIENALRGAQRLATTETIRELIMFPKKLSRLDTKASLWDTLSNIYDNMKSALEGILDIQTSNQPESK